MSRLYENIVELCDGAGVNVTQMCSESGVARGSLSDLKNGRITALSIRALEKIAMYFGVTVSTLLDEPSAGKREISTEQATDIVRRWIFNKPSNLTVFEQVQVVEETMRYAKYIAELRNTERKRRERISRFTAMSDAEQSEVFSLLDAFSDTPPS